MNSSVSNIIMKTIKSIPVEITGGEEALFNSLPTNAVVATLQELIHSESDPIIVSRAFDALLKMKSFDKVQFLISLSDENPQKWRFTCCQALSKFQDPRAVKKLCEIVMKDDDPDVRYVATESLAEIGDETAVPILEYLSIHDTGEDYEGFRVADMANQAIQRIQIRKMTRHGS